MDQVVRQKLALRIVDLDAETFKNAVAKGEYLSAPETVRGSPRLFTLDELVPLWIFARLTEQRGDHARERFSVREAGRVVGRIHGALRENADAAHVAVITHTNDQIFARAVADVSEVIPALATGVSDGLRVRDVRLWDVRNIRSVLKASASAEIAADRAD